MSNNTNHKIFNLVKGYSLRMISDKNSLNDDCCSICFMDSEDSGIEEIINVETINKTLLFSQICHQNKPICKHIYHTICLYKWIQSSKKILCPICKRGYDKVLDKIPALLKTPPKCIIKYHDNGEKYMVYYEENDIKEGEHLEYDEFGRLRRKCFYTKGEKNGDEIEYYPYTGKIRSRITYLDGEKHGRHIVLTSSGNYILKCNYQNGLLHGDYKEWYEKSKGILKKVCSYKNDQLHGVFRLWNEKQTLVIYACYFNGVKRGRYMENYENAKPKLKCNYDKNGELHGIRISFYKNGMKKDIEYYCHSKPINYVWKQYSNEQIAKYGKYWKHNKDGEWKEWYRDGRLKNKFYFNNGDLNGVCSRYSVRGDMIELAEYTDGKLNGKHVIFYPNGSIHYMQQYAEGRKEGKKISYDRNGNVTHIETYNNDQLNGQFVDYLQRIQCNYKDGVLCGEFIQYTNDNQIMMNVIFLDGVLHGECKIMNEEGQLITQNYHYGNPIDC